MTRIEGSPTQSFEFQTIQYVKGKGRAVITFNRPESLNSLNLVAFREIADALRDASWDDSVAAVILTGSGDRAFCSGADLKEHLELCSRPRDYYKWIKEFIAMQTMLINLGKPTIARLNGMVIGAGNEINLACDLSVAADDIVIRQAGTARGSVAAIGVTQWLPIVIGDRRAREVLLLCEDVPAKKALEWGMVNRVVPRAQLDAEVDGLADKLVAKFAESTRYTLAQTSYWKNLVWSATSPHAADWLAIHSGSPEAFEGMQAFVEKRAVHHAEFRQRAIEDRSPEFAWGPPTSLCASCGAKNLPKHHQFCGGCGAKLTPRDSVL